MITFKAPAKINWSLYVLDKRTDGYHNILSLFQCIGLYDTLTFNNASSIELKTDIQIPVEQNLVFRAACALQNATGTAEGAVISLVKEIPAGAGLGGGSSDAAYTLMGLNQLWGLGLDNVRLREIGATLGSDVPFFLGTPASVAGGRGELLSSESIPAGVTLLIIKPEVSISTGKAYQAVSDSRSHGSNNRDLTNPEEKLNNIKLIVRTLNSGTVTRLDTLLHNDFERIAIAMHPVIGEIKRGLLEAGAAAALLSGSGSAVFGLFVTRECAIKASGLFSSYWNRIVETL
jgi:4-diphosphocytidyl-2-C-methyl-D-erythritol kinase